MHISIRFVTVLGGVALAVPLFASSIPAQAQRRAAPSGAFDPLIGSWSGGGTISLRNGSKENIRCQAVYAHGSDVNNLRSQLRCASDSFKFEINTDVVNQGGRISGRWIESTRSLTGTLSGTVSSGTIQGRFESPGFSAALSLSAQGKRQSVTLSAPGSELSGASIALTRR